MDWAVQDHQVLVYRIQDMDRRRKKLVVNFDRLKPYHSRTRSQPEVTTTPDRTTAGSTCPTITPVPDPPGTHLQIVEDSDETESALPSLPVVNDQGETQQRYPQCMNRRRPARYSDD